MEIKYKIWIERDGKVIFGRGRDDILTAIESGHSLNAAARKLEMSYRAAWGRLRASEERMGLKLVEAGPHSKSIQLTPEAMAIIERFEKLEREMDVLASEACREFQKLIPEKGE